MRSLKRQVLNEDYKMCSEVVWKLKQFIVESFYYGNSSNLQTEATFYGNQSTFVKKPAYENIK